jgi:hypothetical protein
VSTPSEQGLGTYRGRYKAPIAKNAIVPYEADELSWTERQDAEFVKPGTARCAMCDWMASGPMNEVIAAQKLHRENAHGVRENYKPGKGSKAKRDKEASLVTIRDLLAELGGWAVGGVLVRRGHSVARLILAHKAGLIEQTRMPVGKKRLAVWHLPGVELPESVPEGVATAAEMGSTRSKNATR